MLSVSRERDKRFKYKEFVKGINREIVLLRLCPVAAPRRIRDVPAPIERVSAVPHCAESLAR